VRARINRGRTRAHRYNLGRVVSLDLPALPSSASRARQLARKAVATYSDDVIDTVAVLVTELVANAVLHARTDLCFSLDITPPLIRISVTDQSTRVPALRDYDPSDATGRGLALVDALAANWGVDSTDDGKSVWCEVQIPVEASHWDTKVAPR
jgi:anti-sigma regulatory factor (Ser/Thr protein kinase)